VEQDFPNIISDLFKLPVFGLKLQLDLCLMFCKSIYQIGMREEVEEQVFYLGN